MGAEFIQSVYMKDDRELKRYFCIMATHYLFAAGEYAAVDKIGREALDILQEKREQLEDALVEA